MILKIFTLRKTLKDLGEARKDPSGFVQKETINSVKELLIIPALGFFGFLVVLFLWGFTSVFGNDSGFAKFLFIAFLLAGMVIVSLVSKILRFAEKINMRQTPINKKTEVRDIIGKVKTKEPGN